MSVHTKRPRPFGPSTPGRQVHVEPRAALTRRAERWTAAAAALALSSAVAGLLVDGVYADAASTAAMLRGFDLVTAALVVPTLAVASRLARQGSVRAQLTSASLVAYLVYTYAYYLFGTGFNDLFLLHALVLATAVVSLVLQLVGIETRVLAAQYVGARERGAAVVLGMLAAGLGGMWAYFAIDNAITGDVPAGSQLVETTAIVHLGMALDLTLLVPLYAAAAVLLWRGAAWGYVLGAISLIAGLLHQVSYVVAMPFQVAAAVPGAVTFDPGEPVVVLAYVAGALLLLRPRKDDNARAMEARSSPGSRGAPPRAVRRSPATPFERHPPGRS